MKIKVTRRIEMSGKVEEKSVEAEIPDDGCANEDVTFQARAADMAHALFESMNPPMAAIGASPEPPDGAITALMLIICDNGIIRSGYCVMGWSSASFISRPANLIIWLQRPTAELRALAEDKMKTFQHSRTINAYPENK